MPGTASDAKLLWRGGGQAHPCAAPERGPVGRRASIAK